MKTMIKSIVAALAAFVCGYSAFAYDNVCVVKAVPANGGGVYVTHNIASVPGDGDYTSEKTASRSTTSNIGWTFYGYAQEKSGLSEFLYWKKSADGSGEVKSSSKTFVAFTAKNGTTTVYAHFHVHDKQYVVNGLTIDYKCVNTATTCKNSCGSSSATLVAADSKVYDGTAYTASVTGDSAATLKYLDAKGAEVTPVEAGSYKVVMTYGDKSVEKTFVITHVHDWTQNDASGNKVTWTCSKAGCTIDAPSVTLLAADKVYDGNAAAFTTAKSADFDAHVPGVTVGAVKYFKADGETEIAAPKYTGSYVAKVAVGDKTIVVPFAITKPTDGYKDGWEVNCDTDTVRYDTWAEALAAATDGDTIIYYHTEEALNPKDTRVLDLSTDKTLTLDLGGETIKQTAAFWGSTADNAIGLTIKNGGTGTLTLVNGRIQQPRYGEGSAVVSTQIAVEGNVVFGKDITTVNQASNSDRYLTFYVKGGKLEVKDGLYQSGFVADGGTVVISGGKFWSYDKPADSLLAENRVVRTIEGDYIYEVFGHTHSFKYVANGTVITLVCEGDNADDCPYTITPQKLVLTAGDAGYTGLAYTGASYVASNDFVVSGAELGDIEFYQGETKLEGAPTATGGYTAKIAVTFGGDTFTAAKAFTIGHDHLWEYVVEGDTLTATCTNTCPNAPNVSTLVLKAADKAFDGEAVVASLENEAAFTAATSVAPGAIKYFDAEDAEIAAPKAAGTYKAKVAVAGYTLEKSFTISAKNVSNVTVTLDKTSVPETGSEITAKIVSVSDGTTTYTAADYDVSGDLTGKDRGEYDVTLTFKGNYSGTAYGSWEIVEGKNSFSESGAELTAGGDYGEVEEKTLTINDTTKLSYDAETKKWFASLTITWPRKVDYLQNNTLGWIPTKVQYSDVAHAWVKIGGTKYTGTQIKNGEAGGLSLKEGNGEVWKATSTFPWFEKKSYSFVTSVTWTVEISTNDLEKALEKINPPKMALLGAAKAASAEPTLDTEDFLNYKATFGAYAWGDETEGDVDGLEDTKFTIRLKPEETTLFDENQIQVWPHHDHDWEYVIADGKCTATCQENGCPVKTIAVELQGERTKTFDGQPLKLSVSNAVDFALHTGCEVSGVQYYQGTQELDEDPQVVGIYYAVFFVNGQEIKVEIEITTADIANAIAKLEEVFDFNFNEQTNELGTIKVGELELEEGVDYMVEATSELKGTGNGKTDTTFTVILNGTGNYSGTKTLTWTVKAPETTLENNAATDGGTLDGTTLKMEEGKNYGWTYYTAENAPDGSGNAGFYAGIKVTWPNSTRWTDLDHAFFKVNGGDWADGNAVNKGEVAGLTCDALDLTVGQKQLFSYLKSVTWYQRLAIEDLRAATKAEAGAITNMMTAIGLVWGKEVVVWYGDKKGVKETDFEIVTKLDGLELYDNDGFKVWPEHDHQWKWTVAGNVLTAACDVAGCQYEKNTLVMTIAPEVAEKYCDTKPVTATLTGAETLVEATEATVGAVEYWQVSTGEAAAKRSLEWCETKLAGAPAEPGDYAAKCTVVSKDLASTNTIAAAFSILTGQAIWNGVHVADAAEYLEKKTQDSMEIFVGKDFTASKTFVVPASWKAETLTEVDMTIKQFVAALKAGEFGDLYTWDDVLDLIAGRVTAEELFKRLQDTTKKYTLLDCGAKTFDLNGFTVTAAEGVPFLRNEGTLTLLGEGTLTTNGCETLLVNAGTLAIEGGKYVGNIENTGALVVSGGYFTGTISNAGEGTVVLTGGAYEIKPNKDFIPAGYDLVKRSGIYYVEKHEHKYTFLPLGKCLMSCTCWNWFVDDPDQIIQFSNCGAHKLGVFIGTRDNLTGILPKKEFTSVLKPVEAEIVGYNYSALLRIGVLKNIKELVAIAEEAIEAEENWDEMNAIEQIKTMLSVVTSIKDLDLDVSDLVWNQERIEEETGLKFGEIKYCDAKTDEELAGAPTAAGTYRASVVITTPKGNEVTRSWKYAIGVDYKTDLEEWAEETKENLEQAWNDFRNKFDGLPTDEEVKDFFEGLRIENLTNKYADADEKIIAAHNKMVDDLKDAHETVKAWSKDTADELKELYEKHEETYFEDAKKAIEKAWDDKNYFDGSWDKEDVEEFFDNLDADVRAWFEERKQNHEPVDEAIIKAHDDMVKELKIVHSSMVNWINKTFGNLEEEAEDEASPAPLLTMAAAPMAAAIEEEELSGWEKFKQEVKEKLGRLPSEEEIEAFFEAEGIRHAQFLETLKAKGVTFHDELKAAHDNMVASLKTAHQKLVNRANTAADELKELYEAHEETYFDEAAKAIENAWYDFCEDVGSATDWDTFAFFEEADREVRAWFEERKQNHEPVDEAIIAAHDKMVNELKEAHAEMVAWLKGRFEQVSDAELKALPEEDSDEVPALLTLSVADESKAYDGTGAKFELKGKSYFEKISGCTVEGPYFRPIKPTGPVTDIAPTAPGHYEVFYWIFKDGKKIEFLVKHVFYIEKLLADHVVVYFDNGTNFVYNAEEQGPKIWGVYCGLVELKGGDYTITGTTNATEVGDYAFTVKGRGIYEMYEETFNWSIVAPTRTFEEGAFQIRTELEYNPCTKTWDTVATLDWPYDLRQIFRAPRYYTADYAAADVTAGSVEPVLREFFRIKTGQMEEYVKADVWTIPFTPEQLTYAWTNGFTAITNTLTAYAVASENEPAGMAKTNFEYVVNLKGLKLYDDMGRQRYPIHNHDWTIENLEDGTLVANCNCKGCPVGHVEISIDAESKDWNGYPVRAEIVDEDDQFEIHTCAEIGDIVYANEAGEDLRCMPTEPGIYRVYAPVVIGGNRYKVWMGYEIRAVDISDATVYTCPDKTEFVYSGFAYEMKINAVVAGCRLLDAGVDYTVTGTLAATDVGDYQIVIEGTGHYTGTYTIDWSVVAPTREFAEDAFDQLTFEVPGPLARKPYGEIEGKVLTVTASTNLWYDIATSNWYAGITVDWPYDLDQLGHAPQYTTPEKAYVKVSTATNVWSALDIVNGEAEDQNLTADAGEFYSIRHGRNESFVQRIGWDIEITLDDIIDARENGKTNITYSITVASPANCDDPDGLAKTTYSVVLPIDENLVLLDENDNRAFPPSEHAYIEESWVVLTPVSFGYDTLAKAVTVAVSDGSKTLVENVDYTVSGAKEATAIGTHTVVVSGIGDYSGTVSADWSIESSDISDLEDELGNLGDLGVQQDDDGNITNVLIKLTGDFENPPLQIPDALGSVTIDLNGYSIIGADGTENAPDGIPAIEVGDDTELTLVGEGYLKGGNGYSGVNPGKGAPAVEGKFDVEGEGIVLEEGVDGALPKVTTTLADVKSNDIYVTADISSVDPMHEYELRYFLVSTNGVTNSTATICLGSGSQAYRVENEKLAFDPELNGADLFGEPLTLVGRLWDLVLGAYVEDDSVGEFGIPANAFDFVFAEEDEFGFIPVSFKYSVCKVTEGESVVLTVVGGNRYKPARAQLSLNYQSATVSDLDLKGVALPMTIEWAAGEMGAKTVVIRTKNDTSIEDDEVFTVCLSGMEKMSEGSIQSCEVTIKDVNERTVTMRVTEPKAEAEMCGLTVAKVDPEGGFVPVPDKCEYKVGSKVTLNALARAGYAFNGWQVVETFKTDGHVETNVYSRTSCTFTLGGTNVVATALFSDTPYVRALFDPSELGKTTGSGYCADGKRVTLGYSVSSSFTYNGASKPVDRNAKFLGWFKADENGQCSDEFVTDCKQLVIDRTAKPYAVTATRYVITNDLSCTTFYAKFETPNRVIIANPMVDGAVAGTVSGDGYYSSNKVVTVKATAKTGYVFAGWYNDSTKDPIGPEMAGEESDLFITKDASFKLTVDKPVIELRAVFVTKAEDASRVQLSVCGMPLSALAVFDTNLTAGVAVNWPVVSAGLSATTVSASGLPAGLKLTQDKVTKAYSITGAPTATKDTTYTANLTVTTAGKSKAVFQMKIAVKALAAWAYGTFNGGSDTNMVTLTVTAAGKISGTLNRNGQRWTLSATSYDAFDGEAFYANVLAKNGKLVETNAIVVTAESLQVGAETSVRGTVECDQWFACQNLWKVEPWKTVAADLKGEIQAYAVPGGTVTLKVGTVGTVTAAGVFGSAKVSCSTVLLPRAVYDGEALKGYCYDVVVYFANNEGVVYSGVLTFDPDGVEAID